MRFLPWTQQKTLQTHQFTLISLLKRVKSAETDSVCEKEGKGEKVEMAADGECRHFENTLQWRHNERNVVPNHRRLVCCLAVCLDWLQRKYQRPRYRPFVRGSHRWPVDYPKKGPVTREPFPFDDIIMTSFHKWTHWHRHTVADVSQTTFPNIFSSVKTYVFWLRFNWSLCAEIQFITI